MTDCVGGGVVDEDDDEELDDGDANDNSCTGVEVTGTEGDKVGDACFDPGLEGAGVTEVECVVELGCELKLDAE